MRSREEIQNFLSDVDDFNRDYDAGTEFSDGVGDALKWVLSDD